MTAWDLAKKMSSRRQASLVLEASPVSLAVGVGGVSFVSSESVVTVVVVFGGDACVSRDDEVVARSVPCESSERLFS